MKFTTAIALTALLGNAAFSNALDVCNRDANEPTGYGGVCNKVCDKNTFSKIWNQVKIQCKIAKSELDIGDKGFVDCFDPQYSTGECKDVTVDIIYGYKNPMDKMDFKLIYGDYGDTKMSWMAFNEKQQFDELSGTTETLSRGKKFHNRKLEGMTFNACEEIPVEMKMKNEAIPNSVDKNRPIDDKSLWYTNRCGISGIIHLCDAKCKAAWEAAQGGNPGADPGPSDPANPAPAQKPSPSGPKPDAPAPTPSVAGPDVPGPSSPKTKAPSTPKTRAPSTPKTKAPSAGKGTKEPSAGKGTKQPTLKGKGTPAPLTRQLKNRKVARV